MLLKIFSGCYGDKPKNRRKNETRSAQDIVTTTQTVNGSTSQPTHPSQVLTSVGPGSAEKTSSLSIAQPASAVQLSPTTISIKPPPSPVQLAPTTSSSHLAAIAASVPVTLSEELWDRAYDLLKDEEKKIVQKYERVLSQELLPEGSIEQRDHGKRRSQMKQLLQSGLQRTEKEAKRKESLGTIVQVVLSAKGMVDSAIQAVPQAAFAWAGIGLALQVRFVPRNLKV